MVFWEKWDHIRQQIDYQVILPLIAKFPLFIGQTLAQLRGKLHGLIDYDWRSQAIKQYFVREATLKAMQNLMPEASPKVQYNHTLRRFMHNSREEWESYLFRNQKTMMTIFKNAQIEGIDTLLKAQKQGRGIVLLTCHLDSFCMGITLMGMSGLRVNAITTSMLENPQVSPIIRDFFQKKIQGMELHMQGGHLKYHETNMSYFYKALRRGEAVVIQADIPAAPNTEAMTVPFLGGMRRMSVGAQRLAIRTNSLVAAYLCLHQGVGKYKLICQSPQEILPDSPDKTLTHYYQFLEAYIHQFPDRWLAADLFRLYEDI